jgi:4-amino-4-deoxy-L-arabinose transferase-like glycosyltransferase
VTPERWPVGIWVAVGAVLRFLWPGGFLFRLDEAVHMEFARDLARDPRWIDHAWLSSAGVPNGPVFAMFLTPFAALSADPRVAQAGVALANVAALGLAIPLFRRLLRSEAEARTALAILATSPVAIWFSRKLWDPCLLALFTVPALFLAVRALSPGGSRTVAFVPPLLALAIQTHQSAAFLAAALGVAFLIAWRRVAWGALLAGMAAGAALLAPWVSYLAREGGGRTGIASLVPFRTAPDIDVVTNLVMDATGHNIIQSAGFEAPWMLLWPVPPVGLLVWLAAVPFVGHLTRGYRELVRPTEEDAWRPGAREVAMAAAVGVPVAYLALGVRGVAHYFLPVLPVLVALLVVGARRLRPKRAPGRCALSLRTLVVVNVLSWLLFQGYMVRHSGGPSYGLPYGEVARACEEVANRARADGLGTDSAPLRLMVDVPRDRGALPRQYAFVLREISGIRVEAPGPDGVADLVLRVRWTRPGGGGRRAWSVEAAEVLAVPRMANAGPDTRRAQWEDPCGSGMLRSARGESWTRTTERSPATRRRVTTTISSRGWKRG